MLIASQLSRSGRLIRRYFFFFGFFFSFRMPVPFAMGSPPLVNDLSDSLSVIIDTDFGGANQFLHVDGRSSTQYVHGSDGYDGHSPCPSPSLDPTRVRAPDRTGSVPARRAPGAHRRAPAGVSCGADAWGDDPWMPFGARSATTGRSTPAS